MWEFAKEFSYEFGMHRNREVIWIKFQKDWNLIRKVKTLSNVKWSSTQKSWYVPDQAYFRKYFNLIEKFPLGQKLRSSIHFINQESIIKLHEELKLKAYSPNTQKVYLQEFAQLLSILKNHPVDELTPERIRSYFLYLIQMQNISETHLNSRINAVKFYFEKVLKRPRFFIDIPRPKKQIQLPKLLSLEDVRTMLHLTQNLKHRLVLKLCYGMGLRVSEIVQLKLHHFDFNRMQVLVQQGKGKKDRYVNLPHSVTEEFNEYLEKYQPKDFLFEGARGEAISIRTIQLVFKQAKERAEIQKKVGIHSLRHSYATHLLEYGTDIRYIQELLGHNSIKTTMAYTHVAMNQKSKIKSPLDHL